MDLRKPTLILRAILALTLLLNALAMSQFISLDPSSGVTTFTRRRLLGAAFGAAGLLVDLGLLALTWTPLRERLFRRLEGGLLLLARLGRLNLALFVLLVGAAAFLVLGPFGRVFIELYPRLFLFWLVVLAGSALLKARWPDRAWEEMLAASLLFTAALYKVASYIPDVSTYPFALSWSETSRFYYASLYFSQQVYGSAAPPTVLHPSRYFMQSLPFLIPNSPLWLHRLWQVLLWIGVTGASAFLLARWLSVRDRLLTWMLAAWAALLLLLGPVYYHLQVPVILLLLVMGGREALLGRPWRALAAVLIASLWAGVSRINWFPVPGMLAATLLFLEAPVAGKPLWRYLLMPVLWVAAGTAAAFAAQAAYVVWSGNAASQFTSSFSSDLLWYRLLPNPTYPLGLILSSVLVSLPFFGVIAGRLRGCWRFYHPIRILGVLAILGALFAGGLLVSVKIGGGSNLHNLDAYFTLLLVVTAAVYFDRAREEPHAMIEATPIQPAALFRYASVYTAALALSLLIPAYFAFISGVPLALPSKEQTAKDLKAITAAIDAAGQAGGEVLFISERQLLTYHYVRGVSLVPENERVFLMEMVMAGDRDYLDRLHQDLKNHRYAIIVSEPLFTRLKGRSESFGEENDAWVRQVSRPVLCAYKPLKDLSVTAAVELYVPRASSEGCP